MDSAGIIKQQPNGTYKAIRVLHYGSPLDLGLDLITHYNDIDKVNKLMSLGTIPRLGLNPVSSPVVRKYGYNFENNPKFKRLSQDTQDALANGKCDLTYTNSIFKYLPSKKEKPVTFKNYFELSKFISYLNDKSMHFYIYTHNGWMLINQHSPFLNLASLQNYMINYYDVIPKER